MNLPLEEYTSTVHGCAMYRVGDTIMSVTKSDLLGTNGSLQVFLVLLSLTRLRTTQLKEERYMSSSPSRQYSTWGLHFERMSALVFFGDLIRLSGRSLKSQCMLAHFSGNA